RSSAGCSSCRSSSSASFSGPSDAGRRSKPDLNRLEPRMCFDVPSLIAVLPLVSNPAHEIYIRFDSGGAARYVRGEAKAGVAATAQDDDRDLVGRIANGDRTALALLYDRYAGVLLAVGRRVLGDVREAEDLVHDVVLEIWRCAGDYDSGRGSVRAWIL